MSNYVSMVEECGWWIPTLLYGRQWHMEFGRLMRRKTTSSLLHKVSEILYWPAEYTQNVVRLRLPVFLTNDSSRCCTTGIVLLRYKKVACTRQQDLTFLRLRYTDNFTSWCLKIYIEVLKFWHFDINGQEGLVRYLSVHFGKQFWYSMILSITSPTKLARLSLSMSMAKFIIFSKQKPMLFDILVRFSEGLLPF